MILKTTIGSSAKEGLSEFQPEDSCAGLWQ
jgi:hypothetical protein